MRLQLGFARLPALAILSFDRPALDTHRIGMVTGVVEQHEPDASVASRRHRASHSRGFCRSTIGCYCDVRSGRGLTARSDPTPLSARDSYGDVVTRSTRAA